ncbi:unnamed protein product [Cuscuta campestris]|uniref:Pentacotripeptide-repeat region of PRORP domain-containing protein n=1 Tax=Cuscuta campestris TaxID=132261 RepID=A0A484KYB6_9ASTE|nr:unnamed protein product [Cuscuta campestris]
MRAPSRLFKVILHCKVTRATAVDYNLICGQSFASQSSIASKKTNPYRVSHFLVNKFNGNSQLIGTKASSCEEYITDEVLNQVLATTEDPEACKKISSDHLHKMCKVGNIRGAATLLQLLRDKKIFLWPSSYNLVLAAASEKADFDLSAQVFKDLLASCRILCATSYTNLARSFAKETDCIQLMRFVKEASEIAYPSGTTVVNRIILAFGECGQIKNALLIFDQMKTLQCAPDVITYNTVLDILGKCGRVDEMHHKFAAMKEAGICPDFVSYNTLINSSRKVGNLEMCLVYLKEMCEGGIKPDLLTFTAIIEAFGRSGNIDEALKLFAEMKQRKIKPSMQTYRSIINNLKKMGKEVLAMKYAEEMNSSSLSNLAGPGDFKPKERLSRNQKSRPLGGNC